MSALMTEEREREIRARQEEYRFDVTQGLLAAPMMRLWQAVEDLLAEVEAYRTPLCQAGQKRIEVSQSYNLNTVFIPKDIISVHEEHLEKRALIELGYEYARQVAERRVDWHKDTFGKPTAKTVTFTLRGVARLAEQEKP